MQAEIKALYLNDVQDFDSYFPEDTESFSFLLRLIVGPKGEDGEKSFDVEVCTPKWLLSKHNKEDVINGRHKLIVLEYNSDRIQNYINKYVQTCYGNTWKDVAAKLSRLGYWEFEDYQEYN